MTILIAGASGLIGGALADSLRREGHRVRRLVRRNANGPDEVPWNPTARELESRHIDGVDAVVNLAGENIGVGRWTTARRERIRLSRVDSTATLVAALARTTRKPRVFLSASAIGFYGDHGDEILDETSGVGHGFLPELCLAWETHAEGVARSGVRTVLARFGVVLAREGGALAKMLPLFRFGLGGRLGSGRQWMSWISIDDLVAAVNHALADSRCAGAMNFTAPGAVTNAEFTQTLARVMRRPALLPVPAWALHVVFGQMADETLLASARAAPARLVATGYNFRHPGLTEALRAVLPSHRLGGG